MLTLDMMRTLWPNGNSKVRGLIEGIVASAPKSFAKYGIASDLVIAHIMAQISHECGAGTEVVENLNYSATRMMQVWPSRFPDISSAEPFAHNPQALANKVYNGRMGNALGTNDGWTFRGRGATQTTGRDGYNQLSGKVGLSLTAIPDMVNNPSQFLECGVADFILCGCLVFAKADDVIGVTRKLNGGIIGLDQRKSWLVKWRMALALEASRSPYPKIPAPVPMPTIPMSRPVIRVPPVVVPQEIPQSALVRFFKALWALFTKGKKQ